MMSLKTNRKLKAYRAEYGLTQEKMASIMEIDISSYNQKENGKRSFNSQEIQKAKNALDMDVSIFFE